MFLSLGLAALPLVAIAGANTLDLNKRATCADVHIILARGNDEPYPGRQGALVTSICNRYNSCDYEDIVYDKLGDPYCTTVDGGFTAGLAQITAYNKQCPNAAIVLSGYSQGGQVIGDILGGGGGTFYDGCVQSNNSALNPKTRPGSAIAAALLWGDIRHTASQSYNILGGADMQGAFPRPAYQVTAMGKYADVLRSYCRDTDPICARGSDGITHTTYFDDYSEDAADWVVNKLALPKSALAANATIARTSTVSSTSSSTTTTASSTLSTKVSTITGSSSYIVPEETNLAFTPSETIASTLLYSAPSTAVAAKTTSTVHSTTVAAKTTALPTTTSSSSSAAAATPVRFNMNLIGMAVIGGAGALVL